MSVIIDQFGLLGLDKDPISAMKALGVLLLARARCSWSGGSLQGMATTDTATRVLDNYVGGRWTASSTTELLDVHNPATGEVLARVPLSTTAELDAAVAAARAALPAWRAVAVPERARRLFALREKLDARQEELARCVTTEMGKTLPDARAEVGRMIEMVEAACAVPTTMQGRIIEDVARNVDAETVRQPVGVCAAIVPFNFPAMVPFWFLPFAIACGNTFVLKPSEQVPLTQSLVFESSTSSTCRPAWSTSSTATRRSSRAILDHTGSTPCRSSGRRRSPARLRPRRRQRQARAGARRGEEPHGGDAGRGARQDGQRACSAPRSAPPASAAWRARSSSPSETCMPACATRCARRQGR